MLQTNVNSRLVFDTAKRLLIENGYSVEKAKLTQSKIRSEVAMSTGSTKFHIPIVINDNQAAPFITERRLQLTDVFLVSGMRVTVAKPATATSGMFETYTYPNLTVFSTANTATSILQAYCNGWITGLVNNDQTLPYWPLDQHLFVPRTQQAADAYYTTSGIDLLDSTNRASDGLQPVEGNWVLSGNDNLDFSINLPGAMTAVETTARWIVEFWGVLAQNTTKIANR